MIALGAVAVMPAKAQSDLDLTKNWTLRAGFFTPERQGPRDAEGDIWFTVGGEREVFNADRYKGTVSLDYYGSSNVYNVRSN